MAKVLLLDDNVDALWLQATLLRNLGHEVLTADSGQDALFVCPAFQPDIVFVDVLMPGMDGREVGKHIHELDLAPRPRVVAVTGYSPVLKWQVEGVFDDVLLKPVSIEQLNGAIAE